MRTTNHVLESSVDWSLYINIKKKKKKTEFWSDLEDKTERLSSLEKFMQIRTKTEVWSKN